MNQAGYSCYNSNLMN